MKSKIGQGYYTAGDLAEKCGVTKQAIYKAIWEGRIESERFAGIHLICRADAERYIITRLADSATK